LNETDLQILQFFVVLLYLILAYLSPFIGVDMIVK
jgi:hypothetical protein